MSTVKINKLNIAIFLVVGAIIGAFIVDIKTPVSFYYILKGNILYAQKNYSGAEENYTKALPYLDERNVVSNNLGNTLYKKQDYKNAAQNYSKMTEKDDENIFNKSHNLGNAFYKLGEQEKDDNKKLALRKNSVSFYKKALTLDVNTDKDETNKNYLFVLDKIKKLEEKIKKEEEERKKKEEEKKKEEQKKQDEKNGKSGSGSKDENSKEGEQKEESQNGQQQNSVGGKTWTNQGTGFSNLGGSGSDSEKLTESEKRELEQYMQYLKDFNKQNQQFLRNGTNKQNTMDEMINNFFGNDEFFNQIIPDNSGNKRDW